MLGLPSLHTLDHAQGARIWFAAEATDMRCGFDRLAERVRAVIGQDPLSGHLFLFRSRRGDRLKILVWEQDGFVLWYKRLEAGCSSCRGCKRARLDGVAGQRVGHGAGWHRCVEAEARAALRKNQLGKQRKILS